MKKQLGGNSKRHLPRVEKHIKKQISEISNVVRKKYLALKLGREQHAETIDRVVKPITDTLKDISANTLNLLKSDIKPAKSDPMNLSAIPPEIRAYYTTNLNKLLDMSYGVQYNPISNSWTLGSKTIEFSNDKVIIDNKLEFKGSEGLYELIFLKNPTGYNRKEFELYCEILDLTNVHKREFTADGQNRGSRAYKYTRIIKPLLDKSFKLDSSMEKAGDGLQMELNDKKLQYIYWDDVNELVDRLRLLTASQAAGNNSHNNEVLSIIEELREAGVIY